MRYFIYIYILIIYGILNGVHPNKIYINNKDELLNELKKNESVDELILTVPDIVIEFENELKLKNKIKIISIKGISKELSILNFKNITSGFIFDNLVEKINLSDLTIKGYLGFNNNIKVEINNVILNGSVDFKNDNNNNHAFNIDNFYFYGLSDKKENCINLYGNVNIKNSYFYGSPTCDNSIIYYEGENLYSLSIINTFFDGVYSNQCLSINNAKNSVNINNCKFERGVSFKNGGGVINAEYSDINITNCKFKDNFSLNNGGIFNIINANVFNAENVIAYNSTAIEKGSFLYLYSTNSYRTKAYIHNSEQHSVGNTNYPIQRGGLIACVEGYSELYIYDFYGENLYGGNGVGAFNLNQGSKIFIEDINLHNVDGRNIGGLLLTSYDEEIGSKFIVNNGNFTDFNQYSINISSSFLWVTKNIEILIKDSCKIEFNNVFIYNVYSSYQSLFFKSVSYSVQESNNLILNKLHLEEYYSCQSLINFDYGKVKISNSEFIGIYDCIFDERCIKTNRSEFLHKTKNGLINIGSYSNLIITNSTFDTLYILTRLKIGGYSNVKISDSSIKYSYFDGLISIDDNSNDQYGYRDYLVSNTEFVNNYGYEGAVVLYSESDLTDVNVSFINCTFEGNMSYEGSISYCISKEHEPYFSNRDELNEISNGFATNPTHIRFSKEPNKTDILSGEIVELQDIEFKFYDDYDNEKVILDNLEKLSLFNEIIFYKIETNDPYNSVIVKEPVLYCDCSTCKLKDLKGNPGNYQLILTLLSYGFYLPFSNNTLSIDFEILECDTNQSLYQDIENIGFKSCNSSNSSSSSSDSSNSSNSSNSSSSSSDSSNSSNSSNSSITDHYVLLLVIVEIV
ncbi:hypothetical protein PIROE2DRAFT_17362 [Piromyces sp. E2]|nr:hypothetical protein PIROE2DRAFT_17362 [Piromyces sp. E2]|eukprot:OUM57601.1 hypothetical protein PIROE2DRAFT_17362 [Piromyces sp. E2]